MNATHMPNPSFLSNTMRFLGEFLTKPATIGAVAPSSASLAREMVRAIGIEKARVVLEYGPGTGVFSEQILKTAPSAKYVAIELSSSLAGVFRKRHPGVTLIQDSVGHARAICDKEGIDAVDCIVSGLPWAAFSDAMQSEFLEEMMRVLRPGGTFATFAYVHGVWFSPGKRFAAKLPHYFARVSKSPIVWRNLPPAFIYRCQR